MKTMDQVKKRIITSMVAILLLIITLFGITYAYFIANVRGNDEKKSITAKAGKLELTYGDGNGVLEVGEFLQPGNTVKFKNSTNEIIDQKTFTVTNTGTATVPSYEVILENVVNELEYYEDLTYTLTCTSYINYGEDTEEVSGTCDGNEDIFPKTNGLLAINSIDEGITHYYVLKLHYAETNTDQSNDMKKNIVAKINIQDDESSLKSMLIYGNSLQEGTPTETTPVEIKSIGERTKNLADLEQVKTFVNNIQLATNSTRTDIFTDENGSDILKIYAATGYNGTTAMENYSEFRKIFKDIFAKNTQYTISFDYYKSNSGAGLNIDFEYTDGTNQSLSNKHEANVINHVSFTTESNKTLSSIRIWYASGTTYIYLDTLQIEANELATDYEPYGYKIPIKVTGKNLFNLNNIENTEGITKNDDGSLTVSAYPASTRKTLKELSPSLKAGQTLTLSMETNGHHQIFLRNRNTLVERYWTNKTSIVLSEGALNAEVYLYNKSSQQDGNTSTIKNIQIEIGDTPTKYEPYKESVYNIYLDAPLRKVGNYVDYIDFANRSVVRNVGVADESGTKPIEESLYGLTRPIQENIDVPLLTKESIGSVEILTEVEPSKLEY